MDETAQHIPEGQSIDSGSTESSVQQSTTGDQSSSLPVNQIPGGDTTTTGRSELSQTSEQESHLPSVNGFRESSVSPEAAGAEELGVQVSAANTPVSEPSTTPGSTSTVAPTVPNNSAGSPTTGTSKTKRTRVKKATNVPSQAGSNGGTPFYKRLKPVHYVTGVVALALAVVVSFSSAHKVGDTSSAPTAKQTIASVSATASVPLESGVCKPVVVNSSDPQAVLPDLGCTPGVIDPKVTQANINQTICVSGYTKTVRSVNTAEKQQVYAEYGVSFPQPVGSYEVDHLISLELGGSNAIANLWLEPGFPNEKDRIENFLHQQVCSGKLTLDEAQREIVTNWYQVYLSMPH